MIPAGLLQKIFPPDLSLTTQIPRLFPVFPNLQEPCISLCIASITNRLEESPWPHTTWLRGLMLMYSRLTWGSTQCGGRPAFMCSGDISVGWLVGVLRHFWHKKAISCLWGVLIIYCKYQFQLKILKVLFGSSGKNVWKCSIGKIFTLNRLISLTVTEYTFNR